MNKTLIIVVILIIIQLIPYGKDHTNPPVIQEPNWDSIQTKKLFTKACADCHSNETKYPWYASIAPISWLVQHDIDEGREHFNVSSWNNQDKNKGEDAAEELEDGEMPMGIYTFMHKEAVLTAQEKEDLIKGLKATFN